MPFTKYFESLDKRINIVGFGEKTINELVYDCSLLITDYSSVAWEAYYQDKTVLFINLIEKSMNNYKVVIWI